MQRLAGGEHVRHSVYSRPLQVLLYIYVAKVEIQIFIIHLEIANLHKITPDFTVLLYIKLIICKSYVNNDKYIFLIILFIQYFCIL